MSDSKLEKRKESFKKRKKGHKDKLDQYKTYAYVNTSKIFRCVK